MTKSKIFCCLIALLMCNGCSIFYVVKQGIYQLNLIAGAEPIETALRKPYLDRNQRKKLELILEVRQFAEKNLKLDAHKNYKDINLNWDKRIHTISASAPLQFKPYLWWFPIIGSVPYKGFFNESDANEEMMKVVSQGYEAQKREIHGYSTLGYFADPVWPAMLLMSEHALVELIIHELAHATVYIPNQTSFNETFANFVGKTGARAYVAYRFGKESNAVKMWDSYKENLKLYHKFFHKLYACLNDIYQQKITNDEKFAKKSFIIEDAHKRYEVLVKNERLPIIDFSSVNNAYLLSFKSYNEDFEVFEKLLLLVGEDFKAFIDEVNYHGRTSTPFISLRQRVQQLEKQL